MAPLIISVSGLRGIVGQSLTPQVAVEYGMAFGTFLQQQNSSTRKPKVCIGRDSRPSGAMLTAAIGSGLMATGCETIDLGIVTTPGVALITGYLNCAGGVVITASHNPIEWNGVKLLRNDGIAFPAEQVQEIQKIFYDKSFTLQDSLSVASTSNNSKTHAVHVDSVLQICDKTLIASKRFKVVLDSINGVGCVVTANLLSELGCEYIHLNNRPTGIFAHRPEPTAENLADLGPIVTKHSAVIGFAQDTDADRLAIIDENGTYIGEEYTLALAAKYVFSKKTGPAAANLSTSRMIDDLAAASGCSVIRTPVGEAHVAQAARQNQCIIAGEGNGGVIDLRIVPVRDSLVGIALILQLLSETGKTVSQLVAEIPRYYMVKTKLPCPPEKAPAVLETVSQHYQEAETQAKINTRDGIRIDLPNGWVHLRASNTEPIMRLIAEASNPTDADNLAAQVKSLIKF